MLRSVRDYGCKMKRITHSGGSIVTSDAITAALLEYTTTVADAENAVTVDITVLEENGETAVQTILLSPASQFVVATVEGHSQKEEDERFPLPDMPMVGIIGFVETSPDAQKTAEEVNDIMTDIDEGLGQ